MKDLIMRFRKTHHKIFSETDEAVCVIGIIIIGLCVYIAIGLLFKGRIDAWEMEKNAKYAKALRIESDESYKYAAATSAGYAYGFGTLEALEPVSSPEIEGTYISLTRNKEHYTRHTRTYTTTDSKGNKQTHTEIYYTWDRVEHEHWQSDRVKFKGVDMKLDDISGVNEDYISTVMIDSYNRYVFRGADKKLKGTMFGNMSDGTVKEARFRENMSLDDVADADITFCAGAIFAFIWGAIPVALAVYVYMNC